MLRIKSKELRRALLVALACGAIPFAAPAAAQRDIVIDQVSQSNTIGSCGTNCLELPGLGRFEVSPTGSIRLLDGSNATFFVASSPTLFQVLSGYTFSGGQRIDFIDFYQQGRSTAVVSANNRAAPDFQIQLRSMNTGGPYPGLEIAFAYLGSAGVPAGATIGYSGSTLGVQSLTSPAPRDFGGFPAEHLVTNDNGLLLGQRAGDSEFVFVVGPIPDTSFRTVTGLLSETFVVNRAAVPEPSTWAMMLLGFGAVGLGLRRRRRRTVATA